MKINFNRLTRNAVYLRKYSYISSKQIEKSVIVSESNDIYMNLALEDWYYRNWGSETKHLLILWSNNPCVVIGKFQNPWLEANVSNLNRLAKNGVQIARRNSGGGTVYHDRGNLNLTFFTPSEHYNRKHNLEVITNAVMKKYGLHITITKRDDLVVGDYKISGTAAKLGRTVAYHHCTLLVNSDKNILSNSLKKPSYDIKTIATQSTKSRVKNLSDYNNDITVQGLMNCIGKEYLLTQPIYKEKGAETILNLKDSEGDITKFQMLEPTEDKFLGLTDIRNSLASWEWIFGKCPKFTATKSYKHFFKETAHETKIIFTIENGLIISTEIKFCEDVTSEGVNVELDDYKDKKFSEELFDSAFETMCKQLTQRHIKKSM